MIVKPLRIDYRGEWTPRQARAVLEVIGPDAADRGVGFETIDISTWDSNPRVILQPICLRHGIAIRENSACDVCLMGVA